MEEIIIDGVNVAGCYWKCKDGDCAMYYADLSADNNELEFGFNCEDNTDCYFKQLQRLEQENAELKKELKKYKDMEAKGLEEFKDVGGCWGCGIQSASDQYFNEAKKYRKALEEIREVVKRTDFCHSPSVANLISVIRHEINEVLGNE